MGRRHERVVANAGSIQHDFTPLPYQTGKYKNRKRFAVPVGNLSVFDAFYIPGSGIPKANQPGDYRGPIIYLYLFCYIAVRRIDYV
jgi:hypothetical protein